MTARTGPTGTVLMRAQPQAPKEHDDARRAARIRRLCVAGIGLFCVLDIGWVALSSPNPAPAPVVITAAPPTAWPASTTDAVEMDPAATMTPADPPPAAAPQPASRPLTPPARHADAKRRRAPSASTF
jgi:hypothetical protein